MEKEEIGFPEKIKERDRSGLINKM